MKKIQKKLFSAFFASILLGGMLAPSSLFAANPSPLNTGVDSDKDSVLINTFTGFDVGNVANDPRILIKRIINVAMGFLGMIAVLVILYAGFKWMTAGGQKEQLEKAQKLLVNGIIGLIIIFSAWTVAWFAVNTIQVNVGGTVAPAAATTP